ncbi:hypothetical protein K456DRAFT_1650824 [Colletotrichum gloeosporioides 23]|nr:hypothetical protein K456DRAFT_1650824 [Colletotrichum gloeosporioides 23]
MGRLVRYTIALGISWSWSGLFTCGGTKVRLLRMIQAAVQGTQRPGEHWSPIAPAMTCHLRFRIHAFVPNLTTSRLSSTHNLLRQHASTLPRISNHFVWTTWFLVWLAH